MSTFKFRLDVGTSAGLMVVLNQRMQEAVTRGLGIVAAETQARWEEAIKRAPGIWLEERNRYVASLGWRFTTPFSVEVSTEYAVADLIENGRPARDLKKMLDTSSKVRRTTDGRRFLVIPFRHNTPGHDAHATAMSPQAYAMARGLRMTTTTSDHVARPVGQVMVLNPRAGMHAAPHQTPFLSSIKTRGPAMMHDGKAYAWGGRLTAKALRAAGFDEGDIRKYAGMVRAKDSAGRNRSSGYLTFRVMIEGQSGWIVPAKPGLHLVENVANGMESRANEIISRAVLAAAGA